MSDSLSLVGRCLAYAEEHGRIAVIDASRSRFVTDLSRYFEWSSSSTPVVLQADGALLRRLDQLTCVPTAVEGRLRSYASQPYTAPGRDPLQWIMPIDIDSGEPLQVALDRDYMADVVLIEAHSGPGWAIGFLARCCLNPTVARRVERALGHLPADYVGIHVRNSDLRTDWRPWLRGHSGTWAGHDVVVCSDDASVLREASELLPDSHVHVTSRVPELGGDPYQLPYLATRRRRRRLPIDTLVDLFALAGASAIAAPPIVNREDPVSAFTSLARDLASRPEVIACLLRRPADRRG